MYKHNVVVDDFEPYERAGKPVMCGMKYVDNGFYRNCNFKAKSNSLLQKHQRIHATQEEETKREQDELFAAAKERQR